MSPVCGNLQDRKVLHAVPIQHGLKGGDQMTVIYCILLACLDFVLAHWSTRHPIRPVVCFSPVLWVPCLEKDQFQVCQHFVKTLRVQLAGIHPEPVLKKGSRPEYAKSMRCRG